MIAESDDPGRLHDRFRFELLLDLERSGAPLSREASDLLKTIRGIPNGGKVNPKGPASQCGTVPLRAWSATRRIWPQRRTISSFRRLRSSRLRPAPWMAFWQGLCQAEPLRAFQAIEAAAERDRWHEWAWRPMLWAAADKIADAAASSRCRASRAMAGRTAIRRGVVRRRVLDGQGILELRWPHFGGYGISSNGVRPAGKRSLTTIPSRQLSTMRRGASCFGASKAHAATQGWPGARQAAADPLYTIGRRRRCTGAVRAHILRPVGRLSVQRAPDWTTSHLIPFFSWSSPDANAMWSARKYSSHIGSPALFEATKTAFLEMFSRQETPSDHLRTFLSGSP